MMVKNPVATTKGYMLLAIQWTALILMVRMLAAPSMSPFQNANLSLATKRAIFDTYHEEMSNWNFHTGTSLLIAAMLGLVTAAFCGAKLVRQASEDTSKSKSFGKRGVAVRSKSITNWLTFFVILVGLQANILFVLAIVSKHAGLFIWEAGFLDLAASVPVVFWFL